MLSNWLIFYIFTLQKAHGAHRSHEQRCLVAPSILLQVHVAGTCSFTVLITMKWHSIWWWYKILQVFLISLFFHLIYLNNKPYLTILFYVKFEHPFVAPFWHSETIVWMNIKILELWCDSMKILYTNLIRLLIYVF